MGVVVAIPLLVCHTVVIGGNEFPHPFQAMKTIAIALAIATITVGGTMAAGNFRRQASEAAIQRCIALHTAAGELNPLGSCTPQDLR